MYLVYYEDTKDVARIFDSVEYGDNNILYGHFDDSVVGFAESCHVNVVKMTKEQMDLYDENKLYKYINGVLVESYNNYNTENPVISYSEDDINSMLVDHEYRLTLIELDL